MGSRRGGRRNHHRTQTRPTDVLQEVIPDALPPATSDQDAMLTAALAPIVVSDAFWVQFAALEPCDVAGCTAQVVPEAWELLDFDTDAAPPGRFCEEHQLTWATRPRT